MQRLRKVFLLQTVTLMYRRARRRRMAHRSRIAVYRSGVAARGARRRARLPALERLHRVAWLCRAQLARRRDRRRRARGTPRQMCRARRIRRGRNCRRIRARVPRLGRRLHSACRQVHPARRACLLAQGLRTCRMLCHLAWTWFRHVHARSARAGVGDSHVGGGG